MLVWLFLVLALQFSITLEPGETRCFRNRVSLGRRMAINAHSLDGLKLDFAFRAPNGGILRQNEHVRSWNNVIMATESGAYELCITSPVQNKPGKLALFWFERQTEMDDAPVSAGAILQRTSDVVSSFVASQRFIQATEATHVTTMKGLKRTLRFWVFLKLIAVIGCIVYQISMLQKYFARRRTAV
ncbi:Transmembrane emp24 domain-containing protein [Giardia muris]|uniref:Transmembrane emp24 domain-containing protein n=1 Tax=Giardia muris TaxID=5742 RepID=A0A4Z1T575_GIAMU|nr:Transmembrane emp24 domain-containing protein [Giardia muris]|eukprot:TNJ28247.1 Transmembrane emp24 domain-containing protein [Giardia muris]